MIVHAELGREKIAAAKKGFHYRGPRVNREDRRRNAGGILLVAVVSVACVLGVSGKLTGGRAVPGDAAASARVGIAPAPLEQGKFVAQIRAGHWRRDLSYRTRRRILHNQRGIQVYRS